MEDFSIIRHGHKLEVGQPRVPLEESGLTDEQKTKWTESLKSLKNPEEDPELTYENVGMIEGMAKDIYEKLPEKALLLLSTTDYPRTRMTCALLAASIEELSKADSEKQISVAYIWEPPEVAIQEDSLTRLAGEAPGIVPKWQKLKAQEATIDDSLQEYFDHPGAGKTHPRELEMFYKLVEEDMQDPDSILKKRAETLKKQIPVFEEKFKDMDVPIYFYGVGHITSLVCLDIAFNGREKYDSYEDLPKPLDLWSMDKPKQ